MSTNEATTTPSPNAFYNMLAFAILMGGEAVLGKSPDYIGEKFARYIQTNIPHNDNWQWGLDGPNRAIMMRYKVIWRI